jgi:hypothetical protein
MTSLSVGEFRAVLQSALGKLGKLDTQRTAHEEIKLLLNEHGRTPDKVNAFFNALTEFSDRLNPMQRKEFVRMYGLFAEVFEDEAVEYIPRIVAVLQKKLKEADTQLHEALSYSFGELVHNTLHTIPDLPTSCSRLALIFKPIFSNLSTGAKQVQVGSALALKAIIQYAPIECLKYLLDKIAVRLIELLEAPVCKGHTPLLECLIALILSVEQGYGLYVELTLPVLHQSLVNEEFSTRKAAADCIYTIAVVLPQPVKPYAPELIEVLLRLKSDRVKPVREAAAEALSALKELEPQVAKYDRKVERKKTAPSEGTLPVQKPQVTAPKPRGASAETKLRSSPPEQKPKEPVAEYKSRPRSIFKGPINKDFFKAADFSES